MINPISDTSTKVCYPGFYRYDNTPWIENSSTCIPCQDGFYSSSLDAYECKECPSGYYCPPKLGQLGSSDPIACPPNYICPPRSKCPFVKDCVGYCPPLTHC